MVSLMMLKPFALILALATAGAAYAGAPDWQQTFDQDMQGPRTTLAGEIVERVDAGDHTCFVAERWGGARFIACNTGYFEPAVFAPGATLKAVGNLGAAAPRAYGGQVLDYPLVAGALISLDASRDHYDVHPYDHSYHGYPYHDPFLRGYPYRGYPYYSPFYGPYFGTGIFFHIR